MKTKNKLELTWIGKNEKKKIEPRILIEDKEKSYGDANSRNMLIHGDNLLALKSLEQDYYVKIKCIYIDPPYNTGSAFEHYNDNLEHSIWLSLMRERLVLLYKLLKDDGIIFIQIDDNEYAYLKVLCDEIFGRSNYLNTISVKMKNIAGASGGGEDKRLKKNVEYILSYTKNYDNFKWLRNAYSYTEIYDLVTKYREEGISWKYTSVLYNKGEEKYLCSTVDGDGNEIKIFNRIGYEFKSISQIAKEEKISEKEVYYKYMNYIHTTAMPQSSIRPRVMEKLNNIEHSNLISIKYIPKTGKNKGIEYEQFYKGEKFRLLTWLKDVTEYRDDQWLKKDLQGTLWDGINLNNLTKEGKVSFPSGKKPEELLKRIIDISTNENDIVLDSFLGSGTTCAVAHKMNRKWIGIEMGEHIYSHCIPRLNSIIDNQDFSGITSEVNWNGGGGYKFYELAPSLLNKDKFDNWVISDEYDADMLAEAMAKHNGFKFIKEQDVFYKQGYSTEKDFIFTTTSYVNLEYLDMIHELLQNDESLLICCKAYDEECECKYNNISMQKIPQSILKKYEFGDVNYTLNIEEEIIDDSEEDIDE